MGRAAQELATSHGAIRAPFPDWIAPQLATPTDAPPSSDEWIHETKYDGYRVVVRIDGEEVRLFTRNHKDWSSKFEHLQNAIRSLGIKRAFLDGELTVLNDKGVSNFQLLQNSMRDNSSNAVVLFLFDLMYLDSFDTRPVPLAFRKAALRLLLKNNKSADLHFSDHIEGNGPAALKDACSQGLEGIVSKDAGRPYVSARTHSWLKAKCTGREEFVIGGFTLHKHDNNGIGALLIGNFAHEATGLTYNGKVGTGFSEAERRKLFAQCNSLIRSKCPFNHSLFLPKAGVHWIAPRLVAELQFTERTRDGLLRHPSYLGLRLDKSVADLRKQAARKDYAN